MKSKNKEDEMRKVKLSSLAMLSALAMGTTLLAGCKSDDSSSAAAKGQESLVECYGVAKAGPNVPVMMTKGMCDKLPATSQVPVNANDYVECYGVAAAGKNDCATNSSACGGTAAVNGDPTAWIAIPKGVCMQLKGSVVGKLTKDKFAVD
jgi:uncharacterized membrane protein